MNSEGHESAGPSGSLEEGPIYAIMFAGLRGFAEYKVDYGQAAKDLARQFLQLVEDASASAEYRYDLVDRPESDEEGDVVIEFGSARDALHAGLRLQRRVDLQLHRGSQGLLRARVGIDAIDRSDATDKERRRVQDHAEQLCKGGNTGKVYASARAVHLAGDMRELNISPPERIGSASLKVGQIEYHSVDFADVIEEEVQCAAGPVKVDSALSLEEAIRGAASGAVIVLKGGIYDLEDGLEVLNPITLRGHDRRVPTILRSRRGQAVLHYRGEGDLVLRNLTFEWIGERIHLADVVLVQGGCIQIEDCVFRGLARADDQVSAGLRLVRSNGVVRSCRMERSGIGVLIEEGGAPDLEDNQCFSNLLAGIAYKHNSGGNAKGNTCADNGHYGIHVLDTSSPALRGNICRGRQRVGIMYSGSGGGEATRNRLRGNLEHGLCLEDQSRPILRDNVCTENQACGIACYANAKGQISHNQCSGNEISGIYVAERACPSITHNLCESNEESGIIYTAASQERTAAMGTVKGNKCSGNGTNGIYVGERAQPQLLANWCMGNKRDGISYRDTSTGSAIRNHCLGNDEAGIFVAPGADPRLEDNYLSGNGRDLHDERGGGSAVDNETSGVVSGSGFDVFVKRMLERGVARIVRWNPRRPR